MGINTPPSPSRKGLLRKANTARATNSVVVVKPAMKEDGPEKDPDIVRLQVCALSHIKFLFSPNKISCTCMSYYITYTSMSYYMV